MNSLQNHTAYVKLIELLPFYIKMGKILLVLNIVSFALYAYSYIKEENRDKLEGIHKTNEPIIINEKTKSSL